MLQLRAFGGKHIGLVYWEFSFMIYSKTYNVFIITIYNLKFKNLSCVGQCT